MMADFTNNVNDNFTKYYAPKELFRRLKSTDTGLLDAAFSTASTLEVPPLDIREVS